MPAAAAEEAPAEPGATPKVVVHVRKFAGYYPSLYGLRAFLRSSGVLVPWAPS